jgi:CubicO group peptidase (beta-lactamase class C family)
MLGPALKAMRLKVFLGCLLAIPFLATPVPAQDGPDAPPAPVTQASTLSFTASAETARTLSKDDLEAWLDGYMPYALQRGDVAGAVVAIVKDGQVLLEKGYGYADVAAHRPVDPQVTLFRPGSVSKLVTWTAVMQQVELGRIDLDKDVNTYLDFEIPPFRGQPVTMRNLMTHTAGFEESLKGLVLTDGKLPPSLDTFIKRQVPARIFPPGQIPAYSNYGAALAGYIVQRVSGQPFDDYIEQHIFAPLGMRRATFRQPLPATFAPFMASGYRFASGPAMPFEMFGPAPAGGLTASGDDMARFMIAHLQDGRYNGERVLQPTTARMMHDTPLTTISPALDRMLLGFYEFNRNGHRIIGHEGDTGWFHSALLLLPDDHVGLFLSENSAGRDGAAYAIRTALRDGFVDRYFPGPTPDGRVAPSIARADGAMLAGEYDGSRRPETNFASLLGLIGAIGSATVSVDKDGLVTASPATGLNDQPKRFEEIGRFLWRDVDGKELLAAKVENGKVVMWSNDEDSPYLVYTPTPWWRNAAWLVPLLSLSIAALLFTVALWPLTALARRRYGALFTLQDGAARSYRRVRIASGLAALLMAVWLATIFLMSATFYVSPSIDPWILILHLLSIIVFPLAVAVAVWNVWIVWSTRRGWRSVMARSWSVVLASSCGTLLWVGVAFHLIGLGVAF